jgi:hypothetical protein
MEEEHPAIGDTLLKTGNERENQNKFGDADGRHQPWTESAKTVKIRKHTGRVWTIHELIERPHEHHDEHTDSQREQRCRQAVTLGHPLNPFVLSSSLSVVQTHQVLL